MSESKTLITDARGFLTALNNDNTKAFWEANKTDYEVKLKSPALALLSEIAPKLSSLTDCPMKSKLFRAHRDVRFSKDKTPYNTHLHMMWSVDAGVSEDPVFFFGIGLNYVTAGAGRMAFNAPMLADWRRMLDLDTDRILGVLEPIKSDGYAFREPVLKRVPQPYPADHRAAEYLRMKGIVASKEITDTDPLVDQIMATFTRLWPLNDLLIGIAGD